MRLTSTYFLAIFLFAISCTPQVTVTPEATVTLTPPPTETAIPTPTLHPQVIELQETLTASGRRFTLMPNGAIQDGAETVPGLTVAPDGAMTLTVDGETVTLNPADVVFDDEKGITIDGYELTNGEWVEAMSGGEIAARGYFEDLGYSTDGVEFRVGEVTTTGWVDGVRVFEMNNNSGEFLFDEEYAKEQAGEQDLMPTDIKPREDVLKATGQYYVDYTSGDPWNDYFHPLSLRFRKQLLEVYGIEIPRTTSGIEVMLNPEINSWGKIIEFDRKDPNTPRYFYYELEDGTIRIVPLMPEK